MILYRRSTLAVKKLLAITSLSKEGRLRHKGNFGEAHLTAADGVVAHNAEFGMSDLPGRCAATPPHEEGLQRAWFVHCFHSFIDRYGKFYGSGRSFAVVGLSSD